MSAMDLRIRHQEGRSQQPDRPRGRRGAAAQLWRSMGIGVFLVAVLLFSAWQHFELLRHGYRIEEMQRERAAEEEVNRQLRLEIETLRSPRRIEKIATEQLHLVAPSRDEAIVIERVDAVGAPRKIHRRRALTQADDRTGRNRPERVVAERQRGRLVPAWAARLSRRGAGARRCAPPATGADDARAAPRLCGTLRLLDSGNRSAAGLPAGDRPRRPDGRAPTVSRCGR